ncbi:uncharacterized protein LOC129942223 [Eupeodes corollae]|uniref:uncharacterized protein LOC129942223 n=1 Tax=Eupeodes corollae TaxID=290404 RepID=UPI00249333BC|nr:uncharacterized protein LOC129942223 [Eupeodes corollae]
MNDFEQNLFSPTSCNPCALSPINGTVRPVKLLKCLGCKLILYCSTTHQKLDWPIHKQFCKAVGKLLTENKINNLFAIEGPIKTKSQLSEITVRIKYKLVTLLRRQLDYHEEELTSFPVLCSVCFSTKYNNLYQCKECNAVSYCSQEHEIEDAPIHQGECLQLKLYYCKFKIDSNLTFDLKLKETCNVLESDLRKAMARMFAIEFLSDPSESLVEYQRFSFVSDFSCIASVSYFIENLKVYQKLGKELTLFVVGSTVDEIWFTPLHTEFLFACFSEISKLNIVFIGPEIPKDKMSKASINLCNGRSLFRKSFKGTLESYLKNNATDLKPDLIVCFNCGFSENASDNSRPSDSWYKGIQYFMQLPNIPILFTSYTSLEADNDLKALEHVIGKREDGQLFRLEKIIDKQSNPYKDMRPLRNWQFNDPERIFFRNGYLQAVRVVPFDGCEGV